MSGTDKIFQLRYVGRRFDGPRLPFDALSDLPAFRDLIVSYAKERWRSDNTSKKRLPKGFDRSISFDLIGFKEGSAIPIMSWRRDTAQATLPEFTDELEEIVDQSFNRLGQLIDDAGRDRFPPALSAEHVRALNKLGSGLREDEKIEFLGTKGADGNVIFLDSHRRKVLITHVRETYQVRYEGTGTLVGHHLQGHVSIETENYGELELPVDSDRVQAEFDGNLGESVQFALQIELDSTDAFKRVAEVFEIEVVDLQPLRVATSEPNNAIDRCKQRLNVLAELQHGWLDGEGNPPSDAALSSAKTLLDERPNLASLYRVFPDSGGGLAFEFEVNGWDYSVEINDAGEIEMYGIKIGSTEEMDAASFSSVDASFLNVLDSVVKL